MSLLRFTFLGTSAAQPTMHRNLSGLAVKADADLLLFDCGEGSQRQMMRYGTGFAVDAVFFTHFHADHYLGIIGFLRTLGMMGREEPLDLYGPPRPKRLLHQAVHLGVETSSPSRWRSTSSKDGDVVRRDGYTVHAVGVDHRINALGYVLEEETGRAASTSSRRARSASARGRTSAGCSAGEAVSPSMADGPAGRGDGPEPARAEAGDLRRHAPLRRAGRGARATRTCWSTSRPSPTTSRSGRWRRATPRRARRGGWRTRPARGG